MVESKMRNYWDRLVSEQEKNAELQREVNGAFQRERIAKAEAEMYKQEMQLVREQAGARMFGVPGVSNGDMDVGIKHTLNRYVFCRLRSM